MDEEEIPFIHHLSATKIRSFCPFTGLCPVSIGTDGGGSIRIPAVWCGVVGFKATYGRFSAAGCAPLAFTVSHTGPLCSSVRDAAIIYGNLI